MAKDWLSVDLNGLAKLVEDRPKAFIVFELLQNAWDEASQSVSATLEMVERGKAKIEVVDDNPSGFADLGHSYTLYAESQKKTDPTKRGRFNSGEKLVLALCDTAEIVTTTGHVVFSRDGARYSGFERTATGSRFSGIVRMTKAELAEVERAVATLLPPPNVETFVNGVRLEQRSPIATFTASLPTVIADSEGVIRRTVRKTDVRIYEPHEGETPSIYEMGIPVVESERYHVDVMQKVPLGQDRDSLPPAFLRQLRTEVLNATYGLLHGADSTAPWIDDAIESKDVASDAVRAIITERFGDLVASYDPSDPEANKRAADQGYAIVHGGSLSRDAWTNVRAAGAVTPAGRIFPTSRGIGGGSADGTEPAADVEVVPTDRWSDGMRAVAAMAHRILEAVLHRSVEVQIVLGPIGDHTGAEYGPGMSRMRLNLRTLGRRWFERQNLPAQLDLIIHEAAHDKVSDHMSEAYYKECTRLGGLIASLALQHPAIFTPEATVAA
jgi:hypothetical protein